MANLVEHKDLAVWDGSGYLAKQAVSRPRQLSAVTKKSRQEKTMKLAEPGDKVKVHYTGKLEDGTIFDSTQGREPLELEIGKGHTVPGFEMGITGMAAGDKRTVTVTPDIGFGPRDEGYKEVIRRGDLPANIKPEIGMQLHMPHEDGSTIRVTITDVKQDSIFVDTNHPLAGKTLIFDIELLEIL